MTTRNDYTDDEWDVLRRGLVAGEEAVRAAGPSGWFGRFKEVRALQREWKSLLDLYGHTDLARSLIEAEGETPVAGLHVEEGQVDAFIASSVEECRAAARLIAAKGVPREAEVYASVAIDIAETAALAHQERGEDHLVSPAEAIVLRRVAQAFGRLDYEPPRDPDDREVAGFGQEASRNTNYE